ncbi:hypothetical protein PCASD_16112 [Puccinia coronata f. sp. avenae]|uniref:Uncharacterized protein n=1 Tax=Puccinia coronata f. sp. avenae TaxID=200324 RepID=A0A2N5TXZ7_9BASI|nr:hypothetical protein PCASD_16112 [Puccinia coronata f. sp. avenae]
MLPSTTKAQIMCSMQDEEDKATCEAQEAKHANQVWALMEGLYDREDPPTPPRVQQTLEEELDEIDSIVSRVNKLLPLANLIACGRWEEVLEAELEALQEGLMPPPSTDQDHKSSRRKSDGARGQPSSTWYPFKSKMVCAAISKMFASGALVFPDVLCVPQITRRFLACLSWAIPTQ